MTVLCAHPRCSRTVDPHWTHCSLHDGDNDPLVCICPTAHVTNHRIGQCDTCGRPIVALHPTLTPYHHTYPQLATQAITGDREQVA